MEAEEGKAWWTEVYRWTTLWKHGDLCRWHVAMYLHTSWVVIWTLTGMCRPLSTIQITDTLQGSVEGRALGLTNPSSSVFHVLRLSTMLSRISRPSLYTNLKTACYTKGMRPGRNTMSNLFARTNTYWSYSTVVNTSTFAMIFSISYYLKSLISVWQIKSLVCINFCFYILFSIKPILSIWAVFTNALNAGKRTVFGQG